ncbi:MAG TPA: DUF2231 domain-containing protein [Candidatus Binataceae bacterium]|nr:DUF2231 domain-containing protein [Candidatus Binataceae bacterium]
MQAIANLLQPLHLHPIIDHFTVALIVVGVLVDLVGSLLPSRIWIRYMAVSLMVLGAIASAGSNLTGGWEADRMWKDVTGPAKDVLKIHAELGDWLPWVFLGLALWRLGVQFFNFMAGTRPIYLMVAVVGLIAVLFQGYKGGELVYDYGVGTALMATPVPTILPAPLPAEAAPIPTVSVPTPTPTPYVAAPPASPAPSPATPVTPPSAGDASPGASASGTPEPKNL